jgi:drug/metabolite transporter (DMT)-like permease
MRLNFWQWIGLILLVAGVAALVYRETRPKPSPTTPGTTAPVVQPTR